MPVHGDSQFDQLADEFHVLAWLADDPVAAPDIGAGNKADGHVVGEIEKPGSVETGVVADAAGLHVLVREERDDWLEQQRAFYERVIAEDSDQAEPALHQLAEEGRELLPHWANVRRLLLVAGS